MDTPTDDENDDGDPEAGVSQDSAIHLATNDVRPSERAEYWQEIVCRNFVDIEFSTKITQDFSAELVMRNLDHLKIATVAAKPHAVRSKPMHRFEPRDDCFYAVIMQAGGGLIEQDGREALLRPGDLALYDATRPHQVTFAQDMKMQVVHVPRARLADRAPGLELCTARCIDGNQGVGAIVSNYFQYLSLQTEKVNLTHQYELADSAIDLLATAVSTVRPVAGYQSRSRFLALCRVKDYVERHLADPSLDAGTICAGVGLSPRYVNKLFNEAEPQSSLFRYVWRRRLEYCHRDLSAPNQMGCSISQIAMRWGFNDLSHFSRAFKARFGVSPSQFREEVMASMSNRIIFEER